MQHKSNTQKTSPHCVRPNYITQDFSSFGSDELGIFLRYAFFFFKGTSVSISVVCTKTWRFHHEKQEAMLAGDSQFQEFFVKLQHLVLSLLANKIERWSFGPGRKVLPFFPHACALKTIKNMYTSWMSMVLSNRIITPT